MSLFCHWLQEDEIEQLQQTSAELKKSLEGSRVREGEAIEELRNVEKELRDVEIEMKEHSNSGHPISVSAANSKFYSRQNGSNWSH